MSASESKTDQQEPEKATPQSIRQVTSPDLYFNRELSQIAFIHRVLAQAIDPYVPLLERVRFLCISCAVLDEFFEVRVAAVQHQLAAGGAAPGPDGRSPSQVLAEIRERVLRLVEEQYSCLRDTIYPEMAQANIHLLHPKHWTPEQHDWLQQYFEDQLAPVLSPLGLDPMHPFPQILNKSLNFIVQLEGEDAFGREAEYALVRAPRSLNRLIQLPRDAQSDTYEFVYLTAVIHTFVDQLFPGMTIKGCYQFRVTRNSELLVNVEEIADLARALQGKLRSRDFASAVRLEVADETPEDIVNFLLDRFDLHDEDVYRCAGPVNLNRLMELRSIVDRPELKYPAFQPRVPAVLQSNANIFECIRQQDILLHHPFDSFSTILELLDEACTDPNVLAIKMTLYRTGTRSPIVESLLKAARNGKDVTAVIELRARFDEGANIELSDRLQEAGVQVVHGVTGHKTHAKMLLVVRREGDRLIRYSHLGTGNYHHKNANAYTDWSLMTASSVLGEDVSTLFAQISGLGPQVALNVLSQSPFTLHKGLIRRIKALTKVAKAGGAARIVAKMNGLTEAKLIRALYRASQAGVKIDLIVRGVCCLRPGVEGISDNIHVRSTIGRFLEHSRIYYFESDENAEMLLSSADWMDRNMFWRIETCFPVEQPALVKRVLKEGLQIYLDDEAQTWTLNKHGSYEKIAHLPEKHGVHQRLLKKLCKLK